MINWTALHEKKKKLGKKSPSSAELNNLELTAAELLGVDKTLVSQKVWATCLGYGMRTLALIAPNSGIEHRFANIGHPIVLKIFRSAATEHVCFHEQAFEQLDCIVNSPHFQQSIKAGISTEQRGFAILEYVKGTRLDSMFGDISAWSAAQARDCISQLLRSIWIPTWSYGLRFKDCHPGNFILRCSDRVLTMIDCEQMRKPASELLSHQQTWDYRQRHEDIALKRLPNLVVSLYSNTTTLSNAKLKRGVVECLVQTHLPDKLRSLGRSGRSIIASHDSADSAVDEFLRLLHSEIEK